MNREEAKELFRSDKDAYGKPKHIMKNIDKIYDDFESVIMKRIKTHEQTIKDTMNFIKSDFNTDTLKRMTSLVESEEIRISELNLNNNA